MPVATAPHGYASRPTEELRTVAVAYDGGEESEAALAYAAVDRRDRPGAGSRSSPSSARPTRSSAPSPTRCRCPRTSSRSSARRSAKLDPSIPLRRRTLNGETAEAIADACEQGVDLLVVGSRGYGTIDRVLLGSTSTALIRKAPCPVLVVPRPAESSSETAATGTGTAARSS